MGLEVVTAAVGSVFAGLGVRTREITDAAVDSKSTTHTASSSPRSRLWHLGVGLWLAPGKRQYQAHCSLFAPNLPGLLKRAWGRQHDGARMEVWPVAPF